MSDSFHEAVPDEFIQEIFAVIESCPRHVFQILTKRPERALDLAARLPWPSNLWLGTSIENDDFVGRARILAQIPAAVRFLSLEPLLGPLPSLDLNGIHWVIAGGESGHRARPMDLDWVRDLRDRCVERDVAFFFKQVGGRTSKSGGRTLDGVVWNQMPYLANSDAVEFALAAGVEAAFSPYEMKLRELLPQHRLGTDGSYGYRVNDAAEVFTRVFSASAIEFTSVLNNLSAPNSD